MVTVPKIKELASLYNRVKPEVENYLEEQVESHNKLYQGF